MDWCLVRQRMAKDDPNPFVKEVRSRLQGLISLIRRQFARLKPESFRKHLPLVLPAMYRRLTT
jgi:hypothetical protein